MYIVREYRDEMAGTKIPDKMVVRAANGRWLPNEEVQDFEKKSTPRCPTYGVCESCYGSGPMHMLCQKCRNKDEIYMIVMRNGKFLDAEWILRLFGTSHLDVRADRTQNWPRQIIWKMTMTQLQCYMSFRWPAGKLLSKENPKFWSQYLAILDEGISATTARLWDAIEHPVEILRWDDPNTYCRDNNE
jgi:hypothetical protein